MSDETAATLYELLVRHRERGAILEAAWAAMPPADRRRVTVLSYYCPNRRSCELLTVWQSPTGRLLRLPPYKLSKETNTGESSEGGRRKNTRDGDRHWTPSFVPVDELWPEVGLPLNCDHYRATWPVPDLLADLANGTPGEPMRRVVGRVTGR